MLGFTVVHRRFKAIPILLSIALLTSACETSSKRDCPAFFHPDYEKWSQQGTGETLTFTDQNGETETFTVTTIERSVPFQTEGFGHESEVSCDLTVSETLVSTDSGETIIKLFDHAEFSGKDLASEGFYLKLYFNTDGVEQRSHDFLIYLLAMESRGADEVSQGAFHTEIEIGGQLYSDVFTEEILNERLLQEPEKVRMVAIASGFGLVQYTRVNGSVFSRVP